MWNSLSKKEKISKANIIYIGGGDTIKLINEIKEYKLDILLNESYDKGTILVGISAGAILLSKEGFSDSLILRNESNKHCFIEGISLNDLIICPHYNSSIEKTNELKEQASEYCNLKQISEFCKITRGIAMV